MLRPENFFDLSEFRYSQIFNGLEYVWDTLKGITMFINQILVPEILGEIMDGAFLTGEALFIGRGTIVEPGALINGPAIIGENCQIRQGAYIRGNVIVGDKCVVGHATEIKNSIMLNGAKAAHFAYIGDSILGNGINLGAGTKVSNLKLRNGIIKITVDGKVYDTGLKKFGAIIGDYTETGCNCILNPGVLLGKKCTVYPNVSLPKGYYEAQTRIKLRQDIERHKNLESVQ